MTALRCAYCGSRGEDALWSGWAVLCAACDPARSVPHPALVEALTQLAMEAAARIVAARLTKAREGVAA